MLTHTRVHGPVSAEGQCGRGREGGREIIQRKKGEKGGEEELYDHVIKRSHLYSNKIKASKQTGSYLFVLGFDLRV